MQTKIAIISVLLVTLMACSKNKEVNYRYYQVGITHTTEDWRDSSFIIATTNTALISEVEAQLKLPIAQRKIVNGALVAGNGGYNKNGAHSFKWHFKEDDWKLTEAGIEIYDGRPYSDVDGDTTYWLHTMERFSPWGSYIQKEVHP